ncbi:MAG: alpha/beta fold hydrolase [Chloroflexi bacterium]|nr:alpha/beta fold hydrolase [Chloroflexota bacterium]
MREQFQWLQNKGQRIASMLHLPDEQKPHPGILMLHGFTGHRMESHLLFVKAARTFARAGYTVLRFDFRGSGESEGRFQDMTIPEEIDDALHVFNWFAAHPTVDPERLTVLGLSMGGCIAAHVAGMDDRVKALILWAPVADPDSLTTHIAETTPLDPPLGPQPDGTIDLGGYLVGPEFLETLPDIKPLQVVKNYTGPALIVHGTKDPSVPPSHAEMYKEVLGDRAELVWVEGADHTFSAHVWEQFVFRTTLEWLKKHGP